ncbi:MAG: hypothetical protein NVS9B4_20840 [Candidatus Acidiferrum sp.]
MTFSKQSVLQIGFAAALFVAGTATGALLTRNVAAQNGGVQSGAAENGTAPKAGARNTVHNKFGQPKTVLHVVVYKFKDSASEFDKQQVMDGIKDVAKKVPGIKNVWLKTERNQIKDYSGVYAIEFASAEAAADYAESPVHEEWSKKWQSLRENSLSFQISNP